MKARFNYYIALDKDNGYLNHIIKATKGKKMEIVWLSAGTMYNTMLEENINSGDSKVAPITREVFYKIRKAIFQKRGWAEINELVKELTR